MFIELLRVVKIRPQPGSNVLLFFCFYKHIIPPGLKKIKFKQFLSYSLFETFVPWCHLW